MKFKHNDAGLGGTCLQGQVTISYAKLVQLFGEPTCDGDQYKVSAEWCLEFDDETFASIYDYKECKSYNGSPGKNTEDITDWHIGGHDGKAVQRVMEIILGRHNNT